MSSSWHVRETSASTRRGSTESPAQHVVGAPGRGSGQALSPSCGGAPRDGGPGQLARTGPQGSIDETMHRQSAFYGDATLYRDSLLTKADAVSSRATRDIENQTALGGMRRPDLSVQARDGYRLPGQRLWHMLATYVSEHPDVRQVVEGLRQGLPGEGFAPHYL